MAIIQNLEPKKTSFSNLFTCYFAATRPAFLAVSLLASLLGMVGAFYSGVNVNSFTASLTLILILLLHAGVNVLNDYFDAINGTDNQNTERLYPFTGGSRFIQNDILNKTQMAFFGYVLLGIATLGGLGLSLIVGWGLLIIGLIGLFIGWAYSAIPLQLNGRGLGELSVLMGFLGIVLGADFVQRRSISFEPILIGMPYALLVTSLLYINQFPDRKADAAAGKRHLVVRLPLKVAWLLYPILVVCAFLWLGYFVYSDKLPLLVLLSSLPLLFSFYATSQLRQFLENPAKLMFAIQLTLIALSSHALLLILVLLWEMK